MPAEARSIGTDVVVGSGLTVETVNLPRRDRSSFRSLVNEPEENSGWVMTGEDHCCKGTEILAQCHWAVGRA